MSAELQLVEPALALLGALAVLLSALAPRRRAPLGHAPTTPKGLVRSLRQRTAFLPAWLRAIAVLALGLALAGPQRVERHRAPHSARDLVLCIDASSSMARFEPEYGGRRIEACKAALRDFLEARTEDRLGLIRFARSPEWTCPPTLDHAAVATLLEELQPTEVGDPEDRTGIGAALALAARSLARSPLRSRVAILVTDGENNVDDVPLSAAFEWCRAAEVQVIALAVGDEQAAAVLDPWCRELGGQALYVRDEERLVRLLASIGQDTLVPLPGPEEERRHDLRGPVLLLAWLAWALAFVGERRWWLRWR